MVTNRSTTCLATVSQEGDFNASFAVGIVAYKLQNVSVAVRGFMPTTP